MTAFAVIPALDVVRTLTVRRCAVVATIAGTERFIVVHPDDRFPCRIVVAALTQIGGLNMGIVLIAQWRAVVAANAVIDHIVMTEVGGRPAGRGMANEALLRRRYVICGLVIDMAAAAGTHHIGMINLGHRNPATGSMAIFAHIVGRYMVRTLTRDRAIVVAADTVAVDIGVVVRRRRPCTGRMTGGTDIAAVDMVRRLTDDRVAVVAAEAGSQHLDVVDPNGRGPFSVAVASLAHIGGLDMGRALVISVTVSTATGDVTVIEIGRAPGIGGMAVGTNIDARDVVGGFLVAARTSPDDIGVIDLGRRCPGSDRMATLANLRRLDVSRTRGVAIRTSVCNTHMIEGTHAP